MNSESEHIPMDIVASRDRLVEHGEMLFRSPREPLIKFTGLTEADELVNDISSYPHAFVLACIMDQQVKAEKAWIIPYRISQRLNGFSMQTLAQLSPNDVNNLMTQPEPLHRFSDRMAGFFYSAIQRINSQYTQDASQIWSGRPSSAEVVYRFLEFDGVGQKVGTMAANILVREFKILLADYYSIDISVDRHIRRVFTRLGLCAAKSTEAQIIYRARALYPEFPGMMDFPCWEIGNKWCKPQSPQCGACYMLDLCPTAAVSCYHHNVTGVDAPGGPFPSRVRT